MHGRGHVWQGACVAVGGGVCLAGGGVHGRREKATAADGKHPTGMHSC